MIRISVEVGSSEAACFRELVRAESIERAVDIVSGHHPDSEVRVLFPIDPEMFFAEERLHLRGGWPPSSGLATRPEGVR
jgi:hypothetical protein